METVKTTQEIGLVGSGRRDPSKPIAQNGYDELAQERTYESYERTGLALERTLAAWLRTGLAMMGVGLGVAKLLQDTTAVWLVHLLGVVLIGGGGLVFLFGFHTYRRTLQNLPESDYDLAPLWLVVGVTGVLFFSTLLALLFALL